MEDHRDRSIADILEPFGEEQLVRLLAHPESVCDGEISGDEWVRIITYLKDPAHRISQLVLRDVMYPQDPNNIYHAATYDDDGDDQAFLKNDNIYAPGYIGIADYREKYPDRDPNPKVVRFPLALCFTDGVNTNEAIIAYKGTTGPGEWGDNVKAASSYMTGPQQEALEFAQNMVARGFTSLTLTGHSKGANKAMLTTIMLDNVTRCVCFDGQGFSVDFLADEEVAKRVETC